MTPYQERLATAAQRIATAFGVGGPSWTVTTPASGLGGTPTSASGVTGKVVQGRLGQQANAAPGAAVEPLKWYAVLSSGTLLSGQQLTDGTHTFSVVGEAAAGLSVYEVEKL